MYNQIILGRIVFKKAPNADKLILTGDIRNKSGDFLSAVSLRVILYRMNNSPLKPLVVVRGIRGQGSQVIDSWVPQATTVHLKR